MEFHEFGRTGVKVSSIGMGTYFDPSFIAASLLFHHQGGREQKIAALRKGLDIGINLIDTAEIYRSEDLVAEAISGYRRDELFIATKVLPIHLRYDAVLKAAEKSLKRLRCSYLDLYQIHSPNPRIPVKETIQAMEKLVEDGKVRFIGVSNFSLQQMKEAEEAFSNNKLASNQVEYNLRARKIEKDLLPYCEQKRIVVIPYRPIAHGYLANPGQNLMAVMDEISRNHGGKTPAQIALNWLISRNKFVFPIPRASRPERVIENSGAVDWRLDNDEIRKLESV